MAIQLSKVRESVLLLSTDPSHNLSDAFGQRFTNAPTKVEGLTNLFAMVNILLYKIWLTICIRKFEFNIFIFSFQELDPEKTFNENGSLFDSEDESDTMLLGRNIIKDSIGSLPGIDELMSYVEAIKYVNIAKWCLKYRLVGNPIIIS